MDAAFDNGVVQLFAGDARQVLREMPADSVHCVVTSPPYLGLRDYALPPLEWGGDEGHEHEWGTELQGTGRDRQHLKELGERDGSHGGAKHSTGEQYGGSQGAFCPCGAWRGSLGLEPTTELYVQHIVEVFREVRRVLRSDGTLWLNMGDSYAGSGKGQMADGVHHQDPGSTQRTNRGALVGGLPTDYSGLKQKDLCMMPARVALALQADGWWLRSDIVWSKLNPMPESVQDRPTRAHEYLFLLTKAERYYYDAESIREDGKGYGRGTGEGAFRSKRYENNHSFQNSDADHAGGTHGHSFEGGRNKRSVWEIATEPMGYEWCRGCGMVYTTAEYRKLSAGAARRCQTDLDDSGDEKCGGTRWEGLEDGRLVCASCEVEYAKSAVDRMPRAARCRRCDRDDAWGSHFATFPGKLVEPCVLAGMSERGVCPDCGAPWERVVDRERSFESGSGRSGNLPVGKNGAGLQGGGETLDVRRGPVVHTTTTGWRPTCACGREDTTPATVLDPFAGSGTVAYVAQRLGRQAIGIDLSSEYLALADKRLRGQTLPMGLGT